MNKTDILNAAEAHQLAEQNCEQARLLRRIMLSIREHAEKGSFSFCICLDSRHSKMVVEQLKELGYNVSNGDDDAYEDLWYIRW